jgi:uncharacterized hydantoinase/oxoprolinase family protein
MAQVIARLKQAPANLIVSGAGEFLARRVVVQMDYAGGLISLSDKIGPELSRVAPAHALAVLAREEVKP